MKPGAYHSNNKFCHFHHEHGKVGFRVHVTCWIIGSRVSSQLWYGEDLFVGYKHYHHRGIEPQWHFG